MSDPTPPTEPLEWYLQVRLPEARAAHDQHYKWTSDLFGSVIAFSQVAMNAAIVINSGGAVAMLAFIGALLGRDHVAKLDYTPLVTVLSAFGVGVLVSGLATATAYVTQYFYNSHHMGKALVWEHPYVQDPEKQPYLVPARAFHCATICLVLGSYAAFFTGGVIFARFALAALPMLVGAKP